MLAKTRSFTTLFLLMALIVLACVATTHARTAHKSETWSSMRVYDTIRGGRDNCQPLLIALCPYAINHAQASSSFGRLSPQARVYCGLTNDSGIMGVFGLGREKPVYITGYAIRQVRFLRILRRDNCLFVDTIHLDGLLLGGE